MYKQQAKSSHNGTMPMDHARRSSSDSDHRNAPLAGPEGRGAYGGGEGHGMHTNHHPPTRPGSGIGKGDSGNGLVEAHRICTNSKRSQVTWNYADGSCTAQ